MIDPTDIAIITQREGDALTLPTPTGGPDATEPQGNVDSPTVRMFVVFAVSLAVGAETSLRANDVPDYWSLAMSGTATGTVSIWTYEQAAGPPIRFQAGGEAILPGQTQSLTIRNTGPIVAELNVLAVRGWDNIRTSWGD